MRPMLALATFVAFSAPGFAQGISSPLGAIWEQSKRLDCKLSVDNKEQRILIDFDKRTICLTDDMGHCGPNQSAPLDPVGIRDAGLSTSYKVERDVFNIWITRDGSLFRLFGTTGEHGSRKDFQYDGSCKAAT